MFDWNYTTGNGGYVYNTLTGEVIIMGLTKREAKRIASQMNKGS